jgi:hypothetical protein
MALLAKINSHGCNMYMALPLQYLQIVTTTTISRCTNILRKTKRYQLIEVYTVSQQNWVETVDILKSKQSKENSNQKGLVSKKLRKKRGLKNSCRQPANNMAIHIFPRNRDEIQS